MADILILFLLGALVSVGIVVLFVTVVYLYLIIHILLEGEEDYN